MAATAPEGYLLCDGGIYAQTQYPALYAAIGDKYNREGTTDGFFCVPDLRELVLVGAGQNTKEAIADHDVFEVGQFKDDQLQNHRHHRYNSTNSPNGYNRRFNDGGNTTVITPTATNNNDGDLMGGVATDGTLAARTGTTTHPKQFGINYYIKF